MPTMFQLYDGPAELDPNSIDAPYTVNAFTHPDAKCLCVKNHNPNVITFHVHHILPLAYNGQDIPENRILLCPTIHYAAHHLLREYVKLEGNVTWFLLKYFGYFTRQLAFEGWKLIQQQENKGDITL